MKRTIAFYSILILAALFLYPMAVMAEPGVQDTSVYERRPFQFTFLFPPLSTNGFQNTSIVNDISLNLFIGVSGGTEAFEAGGFINIDRYHMKGVQLAGFGNTVGGYASGVQLSGFYNVNGAWTNGLQGAGFMNLTGGALTGVQASGFLNVAGGTVEGMQAAGFLNVAGRSARSVQLAGFGNVAGKGNTSFQNSGFFNVAGNVEGAQAAGFINVSEKVDGAQLAGFANVAGTVKGVQVAGFINVCDSIDGIPVSFISVVRKNGYRKLGFATSEIQYASVVYRMGVRRFYNIYSFGKPFGPGSRWMFGGGIGTEMELSEAMKLNVEGTVYQELWLADPYAPRFLHIDRLNLYNSLNLLFGWNMGGQVDLHLGPTFNVSVSDTNSERGFLPYYNIPPYSVFVRTRPTWRQTTVQMWVGIQGSITF